MISIHAPHEGERLYAFAPFTIPLVAISIHAPHEGERLADPAIFEESRGISIHAPHEGERLPSA